MGTREINFLSQNSFLLTKVHALMSAHAALDRGVWEGLAGGPGDCGQLEDCEL